MDAIEVAGEMLEIVGPRQARVRSRSQIGLWYAVDLDDRDGAGSCTCRGFEIRRECRHLEAAKTFVAGRAMPAALEGEHVAVTLATSRYQVKTHADDGWVPVGITVGNPRFKLAYSLAANIREAAPAGLKNVDGDAEFERLYRGRLDNYGVAYFRRRFSEIATAHDNPRLVLLCYEDLTKPGEVCHRRMFAAWWQEQTGEVVEELGAPIPEGML